MLHTALSAFRGVAAQCVLSHVLRAQCVLGEQELSECCSEQELQRLCGSLGAHLGVQEQCGHVVEQDALFREVWDLPYGAGDVCLPLLQHAAVRGCRHSGWLAAI